MKENFDYVQRGARVLVVSMSSYIGRELRRAYKDGWWEEVLRVLSDQRDLPYYGTYDALVNSLDIANCIRIIDRMWGELFRDLLPLNCRAWAKELMGVRNIISHMGQGDLEQPMAERALDTMRLLCGEIDRKGAAEIAELYKTVRGKADGADRPAPVVYSGPVQPEAESVRGPLGDGSLLRMIDGVTVQKTALTRKVTYGGKTVVYPVYRVRLDALYYNDQNDRIATWITGYEAENGKGSLEGLDTEIYNRIIEGFICESNPDAIQKTQKNIALIGQREPGVTLADGRIVDGNRRFTCLRRIARETGAQAYFETVIMDMDIRADKKQIKLLELAVQHGEEKKVDYDLIDFAIGTYRDIVQTRLLTVDEYVSGTNETAADVRKRIEIAGVICEFLDYLGLPEQYHVAREYQVFSLFEEMMAPMRQLDDVGKAMLKEIAFVNVITRAIPDQRKFIRDIKTIVKSGQYLDYSEDQRAIISPLRERYKEAEIRSKKDIDDFSDSCDKEREELALSMERALFRSRSAVLKNKPAENLSKCVSLMTEIDPRLFGKLDEDERADLKAGLEELIGIAQNFISKL